MVDYSSIVLSSKVQLARNLNGFIFPSMFEEIDGIKIINKISDSLIDDLGPTYRFYKIGNLSEIDKNVMKERDIISEKLINAENFGGAIVSDDEKVSIMINEEDHIKEQCEEFGLNLISAYDRLNEIDNLILTRFDIAYDDSLGFLTSCVDQVGTGLSASVKLFLPALARNEKISEIRNFCLDQGFDLSPVSFDDFKNCLYHYELVSKQSIGRKETDIIFKLTDIAIKICKLEIESRNELLNIENKAGIIDSVYRAWGILTNCYKITTNEAQNMLAELKMGVPLDIVKFKDNKLLDYLMLKVLPYSLSKTIKNGEPVYNLDEYRAKFLSDILKTKRIK